MSDLFAEWINTMRAGDHERGWALSERQRQLAIDAGQRRDDPAQPYHLRWVWDGRPFEGRDVLVRCYHGLGDTIQFLRFLPELRRRAASVTLELQPRLLPLVQNQAWVDRVIPFDMDRPHPPAECDIEIMELSLALRARPANFPPPYLEAGSAPLAPDIVGLCCQAGGWDPARSLPPEMLADLCEGRECVTLDPLPSPLPVANPEGCPFDLVQTAELVAGAALVITVDTMIAHLAGALNRPTWLMLKHQSDWRWTPQLGRSEWYPSMRLYAQPSPGDWSSVVTAIAHDLDELIPKRSQPHEPRLPICPGVLGRVAGQDHHPANQV